MAVLVLGVSLNSATATATEKSAAGTELRVGAASTNITPEKPVALSGQMHLRVSKKVDSPVTANVVVLESRKGDRTHDTAVMVSCDLVVIEPQLIEKTRQAVHERLPELNTKKIFFNATHTHTGPVTRPGIYRIPDKGVTKVDEYHTFFAQRVADAVEEAWKSRAPGGVSWGLGHAVVALNRRAVYADGSAQMYGPTHVKNFRRMEGPQDHGVEVLFFWDKNKKLIATAVNVACPSQEVESLGSVNADFWHEVRIDLRKKYGKDLVVLGWCGASGDQSPHLQWREQAEERMRKKRGLTRLQEIARRVVRAVDEAYEVAKTDIRTQAPLVHVVKEIELPLRMVTDKEYGQIKAKVDEMIKKGNTTRGLRWRQDALARYKTQKPGTTKTMELHVIRLGDVAIATNDFELFTDFGIQMKCRSKALQTFVIQLCGKGTYIPTARAEKGGGYSATVESNLVGSEGGQVLVERTVEEINKLDYGRKGFSGKVTVNGQPLETGTIVFLPAAGTLINSSGGAIKNGEFTIAAEHGLPVGKYKVTVQAFRKTGRMVKTPHMGNVPEMVPVSFLEAGTLKAEITADGENHFDFKLTKRN